MNSTQARDLATHRAKSDPRAALEAARKVEDSWFRAQALAWVGRYSAQPDFRAVITEAKFVSLGADDPYKVVGSSAWWVRAMIERGDSETAALEVKGLLLRSSEIPNPVSRLDALFLLFEAVFDSDISRPLVLNSLICVCLVARSWKAGDRLREAALMLAPSHPDEAKLVIASMPDGKYRRTAIRRLATGEQRTPRLFFW